LGRGRSGAEQRSGEDERSHARTTFSGDSPYGGL
jgi:hypothetical protein